MTGKETAWLFGGLALIALSLGMIFLIPYQTVTTASIQADQSDRIKRSSTIGSAEQINGPP